MTGAVLSEAFLSRLNISNVLTQVTPLLVVAIGQTFAIASGGIDLSVGSTVSLVTVVAASTFEPYGVPVALVLVLLVALAVGLVNGLAVAAGLDAFLVTLATLSMIQGATFLIQSTPGGRVPPEFGAVAGYWGPVPLALPIMAMGAAAAALLLRRTRLGTHMLAVGGDPEVARLSGVRVRWVLIWPYVLSALAAAIAGMFLVARIRTGSPIIGTPFTLDSLAAVVLGGTTLGGGRATMFGSVVGALSLGLLANALNLSGVPAFYQTPVKGLIIVLAVLAPNIIRTGMEGLRRRRAARI